MPSHRYISLLRGINVGQSNRITQDELIRAYTKIHLTNLKVHIQSGNVIFDSARSQTQLSDQITSALKKHAGLEVPVVVLSAQKLKSLVSKNPYTSNAKKDPAKVHYGFLAHSPTRTAIQTLNTLSAEPNQFEVGTRVIYLFTPQGMGRAKLPPFEKILRVPVTFRNSRVVDNLIELSSGPQTR